MKKKFGTIMALTFFAFTPFSALLAQSNWKMQPIQLKTRWAKDVSPNSTLNAYPRPQMVRKDWTNLNGLWDYAISKKDSAFPQTFNGKILVPYPIESALSGVKKQLLPTQNLWYRKLIQIPAVTKDERILLHFGAVDWQSTVFVNGVEVGSHAGGYTAFSFDVTDMLKTGNNEVLIKVYDPTNQGIAPSGKQVLNPQNIYYTPSSGIWQTVWLEKVGSLNIENIITTPNIDKGILEVSVSTNKPISALTYEVIASVNGKIVSKKTSTSKDLALIVKNARLWSPDDPFLYDLTIRLKNGAKIIDEVKSYFGMRKIAVQKDDKGIDRIFLNNKYTYNLGTLDQGFWPEGLYTAPTDEALKFDIQAIKAMGFNTIRKHIKVEPARWYYYADKLGMMVWQDMVNPNQGLPAGSKEEFEKESAEIVKQLHNYPSITTYVLFNEKWGQYDQERLTKWLKNADPSRIVNGHSGEYLYVDEHLRSPSPNAYVAADMTDVHSYPNPMMSIKQVGKAQVCGEFGGIGVPVPGHQWDDIKGWGYVQVMPKELAGKYDIMVRRLKMLESEGLSGSIYTQPFDVEGEENGLMTYDREVIKIPLNQIRAINGTLIHLKSKSFDMRPSFNIGKSIDENDTDQRYPELTSEYNAGKRDSAFLRRLTLMAIRKKDQQNIAKFASSLIHVFKTPFTHENLSLIVSITKNTTDPGFAFIKENTGNIDDVLGNEQAEIFLRTIIIGEIISPLRQKHLNPDFEAIEKYNIEAYGQIGERAAWNALAGYAFESKNVSKFVKYKDKIHAKYPEDVSNMFYLNNDAWFVFENSSQKSELESALNWQKKVIQAESQHPDPGSIDTYANLFYKAGRKEEAIRWEEKAVELSMADAQLNKNLRETLEKMNADKPTWP